MSGFAKNIKQIEENIEEAALKSGRDRKDITFVAVSKNQNIGKMLEAKKAGISIFGENRARELRDKVDFMGTDTIWHFIGHLQKSNVKHVLDKVSMIHSIDSVEIASELNKQASQKKINMPILMQINIANEESKFGFSPEESIKKARELAKFEHLQLNGLMTVAPFAENPEDNRKHYKNLRKLFVDISADLGKYIDMKHLSMGMSRDYMVAIEEGATMVRIGTSLFGDRY